jgi:hypothetical protein
MIPFSLFGQLVKVFLVEQVGKRLNWLREAVEEGMIDPIYVPTEQQLAGILTKAVTKKVVEYAVPLLGLE